MTGLRKASGGKRRGREPGAVGRGGLSPGFPAGLTGRDRDAMHGHLPGKMRDATRAGLR